MSVKLFFKNLNDLILKDENKLDTTKIKMIKKPFIPIISIEALRNKKLFRSTSISYIK